MKTYENDGNLNYADLSVYDISIDKCYGPGCKGYWPCSDSRCAMVIVLILVELRNKLMKRGIWPNLTTN